MTSDEPTRINFTWDPDMSVAQHRANIVKINTLMAAGPTIRSQDAALQQLLLGIYQVLLDIRERLPPPTSQTGE